MMPASPAARFVRGALVAAIIAFAWWRFSENTADNDLWGHVLYGERTLAAGAIERTDPFSWTAPNAPWINHEVLAECALGLAHRAAGGTGIWLLMIIVSGLTVIWALRQGAGVEREQKWVALLLLAASTNFIALGCAARPQLFTLLALVALLSFLRRFLSGAISWGSALPPLFAVWANTHGGFLAGLLVLITAALAECASLFVPRLAGLLPFAPPSWRPGGVRIIVITVLSILAVALNPWGLSLLTWTIQSVRLPRPWISEWQPTSFTFANLPFFIVLAGSAWAWIFTRRPRRLWEAAVLVLLAAMALASRRHQPLFGLANLILTPRHLADAYDQMSERIASLRTLFARTSTQWLTGFALLAGAVACLHASVSAPRQRPFTIEVPRDEYPVAAIAFIRAHRLTGNMLTYFDWGQQVLWELPYNPVSFDGRLDTVYPPDVMNAHWDFYAGKGIAPALAIDRAPIALLPASCGGVELLRNRGWHLIYRDPLACILVPPKSKFSGLDLQAPPTLVGPKELSGRDPFPTALPELADPRRRATP